MSNLIEYEAFFITAGKSIIRIDLFLEVSKKVAKIMERYPGSKGSRRNVFNG